MTIFDLVSGLAAGFAETTGVDPLGGTLELAGG